MISVICIYNDKKILNDYLLKSIKNQTVNYELITLDNTEGKFKSAAEALNYGGKQAKEKYLMFVHQDVDLCSSTWLEETEKILDSIPDLGIAGVAGMTEDGNNNKERGRNIIKHGDPAIYWSFGNPIQKPEPVQTLDECLVLIPKSAFNILQFDEKVCDDWHLYVVDYCLSAKKIGVNIYAIPMFIYHRSVGIPFTKDYFHIILDLGLLPNGYYRTLKKLLKKHKNYFKRIFTTTGDWHTYQFSTIQKIKHLTRAGIIHIKKKLQKGPNKL